MYHIGLLLLTGPFRIVLESISQYLKCANRNVIERLYVKLEPEFSKPLTKSEVNQLKRLSNFAPLVYNKASTLCRDLDVRVILSDTKKRKTESSSKFDIVLTNSKDDSHYIVDYINNNFTSKCDNVIKIFDKEITQAEDISNDSPQTEFKVFKTVCLGGTFDRLHNGHKVLLSEAALRATEKLIVGVTDGEMLKKKFLSELIEPVQKRIAEVTKFLLDVDPSLHYEVVPITDPYGPTISDPDINCIVVSAETVKGGERVNVERKNRGMDELTVCVIDLLENREKISGEEEKLSSSTQRMHLLGTCLKVPRVTSSDCYTILLQGQPLTGKSYISNCFQNLGAIVISCSEIIVSVLKNNKSLKEEFLHKIGSNVFKDGSLNYRELFLLCLNNKERRQWVANKLCEKVSGEIKQKLQHHHKEGSKFIVIKDSFLLNESLKFSEVNELWATIMSTSEIANRLSTCHNLSNKDALDATLSMSSSEQFVEKCNRLFCCQWSTEITEQQVIRAWSQLELKT